MKLNDISIKTKLLSVSILFIITILSFGWIYYTSSREIARNSDWVLAEYKIIDLDWGSSLLFERLVMPANDYISTGSTDERMNFERLSGDTDRGFADLKKYITSHSQATVDEQGAYQENLDTIEGILHNLVLMSTQILNEQNPVGKKDLIDKMRQIDSLSLELHTDMAKLADIARSHIVKATIAMVDARDKTDRAIVGTGIFIIILIIALEILVQYFIVRRVKRLIIGTKEFTSGNFDYVLRESKDELGVLAQSFNEMAGAIKKSRTELVRHGMQDVALHDLLKKLGSSMEIGFIMRSIAETARQIFPDIVVSYVIAPMGPKVPRNTVAVYASGKIGEQYLSETKNILLLGLDTLPSLKAADPLFDKWKNFEFEVNVIEGEQSLQSQDVPRSSVNIPLVIPQSIAGIFNFSSSHEGVFGESEISVLYSIVSCASETVERLRRLLNDEQQRMVNLTESIGDGVLAIDRSWNVVLMNKAASQISGFNKDDVIGRPFRDIFKILRERDRAEDVGFIEKAMTEKATQSITEPMIFLAKDGREVPIGDSASPFMDQMGEVIGAIVVFRDITKEREAQGLKSDFAYASHQLRTPVSKAMWNLEVALDAEDIEKLRSAAHVAYDSMKSVQKLSEELLEVSRIDRREISLEKERILVSDIVVGVVDKMKKIAEGAHVELVSAEVGRIEINTNKKLLNGALMAILDNALLYNHAGGRAEIKVQQQENGVLVEVSDNGIGIAEEHRPLIFTKFFRGSNFDTTAIAGAGLGLYIAKSYITLLGGKIWFESEEGKGTTFFISLPIT